MIKLGKKVKNLNLTYWWKFHLNNKYIHVNHVGVFGFIFARMIKVRYNRKFVKIHFWKFSIQFLISNVDSRLCVHLKVLKAVSSEGAQLFPVFSWNNSLPFTKLNIFKDSSLQYFVLEILNNQDLSIETLKYNVKFVQSNKQQEDKTLVHI
jgi:hypothetical protein